MVIGYRSKLFGGSCFKLIKKEEEEEEEESFKDLNLFQNELCYNIFVE